LGGPGIIFLAPSPSSFKDKHSSGAGLRTTRFKQRAQNWSRRNDSLGWVSDLGAKGAAPLFKPSSGFFRKRLFFPDERSFPFSTSFISQIKETNQYILLKSRILGGIEIIVLSHMININVIDMS
jgi:hypothetical protein